MAIKAQCGSCKNPITVRDEFGGKTVKCPKCKTPMKLPEAGSPAARSSATSVPQKVGATSPGRYNPLLDLLDEAGVESRPTGPVCDHCHAPMSPTAIICIECGYNMATGQKLETAVLIGGESEFEDPGMTDGEKLIARAEKAIDDSPVTSEGQDFGDNLGDSYLISVLALVGATLFIVVGLFFVLSMDWIIEVSGIKPTTISLLSSIVMYYGCGAWITITAFRSDFRHGLACILSNGFYCPIFAFMNGGLLIPAIVMLVSNLIFTASWAAMKYLVEDEDARHFVIDTTNQLMLLWN